MPLPEPAVAAGILAMALSALAYLYYIVRLARRLETRYPGLREEALPVSAGLKRGLRVYRVVFAHKKLRAAIRRAGIRDAELDRLVRRAVYWYRCSIALAALLAVAIAAARWSS